MEIYKEAEETEETEESEEYYLFLGFFGFLGHVGFLFSNRYAAHTPILWKPKPISAAPSKNALLA